MCNNSLKSLSNYQTEFYNMMVNNDRLNVADYIGDTFTWQLDVYQNNYHQCLLSTLNKTFNKTVIYLENNDYDVKYLFNLYIKENPSTESNLALYGARFSSWLKSIEYANIKIRIAADFATLDYALYQCYYASNSRSFLLEAFLALNDADKLNTKFQRLSSIFLLTSQWDLIEHDRVSISELIEPLKKTYKMLYYVVFRELGIAKYELISNDMYCLLSELRESKTLLFITEDPIYNSEVNMPKLIQRQWVGMQ
jgi:hypothetical protein